MDGGYTVDLENKKNKIVKQLVPNHNIKSIFILLNKKNGIRDILYSSDIWKINFYLGQIQSYLGYSLILGNYNNLYCIWETKHLSTDAASSADNKKNPASKAKLIKNQTFFCSSILHPLWAKVFKSETTSFPLFSQRIRKIKKVWTLDFGKWGQKDV